MLSANLQVSFCIEGQDLRFLCRMSVVRARVDAKALQHIGSQRVPLQHSAHRGRHRERRIELLGFLERALAQAARVARVPRVHLGLELAARDLDFGRIDDHDVVAGVEVRRERGLVLAAQDCRHARGKAAEHLVRRIHDKPLTLQIRGFRRPRLLFAHRFLSKSLPSTSAHRREPCGAPCGGPPPAGPPPPPPARAPPRPPPPPRRPWTAPPPAASTPPPPPTAPPRLPAASH